MSVAAAYSEQVRRLFQAQHAGDADGIAVDLERGGDRVVLSARVEDGRIAQLAFRVLGCPHLIAAAEAFCEAFEGQDAADLAGFAGNDLLKKLAIPVEKTGRILLLEDAVRALQASIAAQAS